MKGETFLIPVEKRHLRSTDLNEGDEKGPAAGFGAFAELGSLLDLYNIVRLQQIRWESLVCGSGLSLRFRRPYAGYPSKPRLCSSSPCLGRT